MSKPGWVPQGVECPECGCTSSTVQKAGFDAEGHRIRVRHCRECEHNFGTVEVALPNTFSFNATDVFKSERDHDKYQQQMGRLVPRAAARASTDIIAVNVRIHKGKKSDWCRKGLHLLKGENLYIRPPDGHRICRACAREANRRFRELNRKWINERRNELNREKRAQRSQAA